MGEANRKHIKDADWLKTQFECYVCGGVPDTVDHFPSRNLFSKNQWPEGYRFAACDACNQSTKLDEQVMAFIALSSIIPEMNDFPKLKKITAALRNNWREGMEEWADKPSSRNSTRTVFNHRFGKQLGDALSFNVDGVTIGPITQASINAFMTKLIRALFVMHVNTRLIGWAHLTMINKMHPRSNEMAEAVLRIMAHSPTLSRGNRDLSDQFVYRYNASMQERILAAVIEFPVSQFIFCMIAANQPIDPLLKEDLERLSGWFLI